MLRRQLSCFTYNKAAKKRPRQFTAHHSWLLRFSSIATNITFQFQWCELLFPECPLGWETIINRWWGYEYQELNFSCKNNYITKLWALDLVFNIYTWFYWHWFHMFSEIFSEQFQCSSHYLKLVKHFKSIDLSHFKLNTVKPSEHLVPQMLLYPITMQQTNKNTGALHFSADTFYGINIVVDEPSEQWLAWI